MDVSRLVDLPSPLSIECPHCGHADVDDLELVEPGRLQAIHCAECGADFHCAVMECHSCGAECLFCWATEPDAAAIDHLTCPACARSYVEHEAPSFPRHLHA